jgi:hypothetical protein
LVAAILLARLADHRRRRVTNVGYRARPVMTLRHVPHPLGPRPACRSVLTGKAHRDHGRHADSGGTTRAKAHLRDGLSYTSGFLWALPEVLVPLAVGKFDAETQPHPTP